MSTLYTTLFPDAAVLLKRKFFIAPGSYNFAAPAGARSMRALASGCGGQGDNQGGGGAFARAKVAVTAGENIRIQVGQPQSASTPGDSWVARNDMTYICYADRGRGNSNPGLASNSVGDVKRDGTGGLVSPLSARGGPAGDASDYGALGFGGYSVIGNIYRSVNGASDAGGGGFNIPATDENGVFLDWIAAGAGPGLVCLEFFDIDPGY